MERKKILRIAIPLIMVCGVLGIWLFQNASQNETSAAEQGEFPLTVTSIDVASLTDNDMPIIIDFGADECVPCKEMKPVLELLNQEMQGKAIIQFVDVWQHPQAVGDYPVTVIPTQLFVNADGTPYVPSDEVSSEIQFDFYAEEGTEVHSITMHQGGLTEDQMRLILADMGVES